MGPGRHPQPVQTDRCEASLLAAGVRLAGDPLDAALRLEAVDQPGDPAARQDHPLGQDVHPDAPTGRGRDLEERVVFGERQAVGRLELIVEPPRDPRVGDEEAAPGADTRRLGGAGRGGR